MVKFDKNLMTRCFPIPSPGPIKPPVIPSWPPSTPGTTLSLKDRFNAARLPQTLNTPAVRLREMLGGKKATVTFEGGLPRGPEGQPLITVKRGNDTLYVDPNTNQYYKAEDNGALYFRKPSSQAVSGPYPLPADAQFSNSHFSDADVRAMNRPFVPIRRDQFEPVKKPALPGIDVDLSKILL